ncbi:MAG: T9SS type A sorting domain-containing protein [Bacteroidia bacterium]|nr:T9SS type A sorting domain-containing protein [Bacteroidia bacterium]
MNRSLVTLCFSIIIGYSASSQTAVGQWRTHLPYSHAIMLSLAGDTVYCASDVSLFSFNKINSSIDKMTKVSGLSDVSIKAIRYSSENKMLFIGYDDANIDLVKDNSIYNISDIQRKEITGNKTINNIMFINNYAYLSCGFGIVVVNLQRKEIKDTYLIGDNGGYLNVYETAFDGMNIYAATENGIYKADINSPNLANYQFWTRISYLPNFDKKFGSITFFNGRLYTIYDNPANNKDTIYSFNDSGWDYFYPGQADNYLRVSTSNNHLIVVTWYSLQAYDTTFDRTNYFASFEGNSVAPKYGELGSDNWLWVADGNYGLIRSINDLNFISIIPNGPFSNNVVSLTSQGNDVWAASGGRDASWQNLYSHDGVFSFVNEYWKSYNDMSGNVINQNIYDLTCVAIDPSNTGHVYLGSWGGWGVIELMNQELVKIYNDSSNSTLQSILPGPYCKIGGMCFDRYGNLWVTNAGVDNPLSVRFPDGTWKSFALKTAMNSEDIANIIVTQNDHKWIVLPRGEGLFAFYDNGTFNTTSDDQKKKFSVLDEYGSIISNDIYSIAEDLDGTIWVGTSAGVAAYYNPYNVFDGQGFYAQKITIDIDGTPQYLLATETVTAIAVDGANRKWFGTEKSGVFLMSADCTQQVEHFNSENSPLLSDNITSITINNTTGEVFFGTDLGIISYKSTATLGPPNYSQVYVYPDPVRENYTGLITIKGIIANSDVKITDVSGNLVYETKSLGGQAIWDGKNFSGEKASTGVYMIFCTNDDGSKTYVGKMLFVK